MTNEVGNTNNEVQDVTEKKKKSPFRHMQAKLTPEVFKKVEFFLLENDISDKSEWLTTLIMKEVNGYEPVRTDKRLPESQDGDGINTFRSF